MDNRQPLVAAGTMTGMPIGGGQPRFLALADVAEVLNTSINQVYALVRRGELVAMRIGGRGQWRVETNELEAFIERQYSHTRDYISRNPWGKVEESAPAENSAPDTADGR